MADLHFNDLVFPKPEFLQRTECFQVLDFLIPALSDFHSLLQQDVISLTRILFAPSSKFLIKVNSSKPSI